MTQEKTIQCPVCKEPYKIYLYFVGDQSACSQCIRKAEQKNITQFNRYKAS